MPADSDRILETITSTLRVLRAAGEEFDGLIPSTLDPDSGELLSDPPQAVPGQRAHDRAPGGCNLLHDVPLLRTMDVLGRARDVPELQSAVDRYVETFARRCTGTETGLFPWGEHAYWDLEEGTVGNGWAAYRDDPGPAVHDHFHHVPAWFWRRLAAADPDALEEFATGLEYHYSDPEHPEFNRHAYITERSRYPTDAIEGRSCDFPRHSGHFVYDWSVATVIGGDSYADRIERMVAYWYDRTALHHDGMLPLESRGYNETAAPNQTLSLAISLLDAADVLETADEAGSLADHLRDVATAYLDAYLAAGDPGPEERLLTEPTWASVYGGAPPGATAASEALKLLSVYRHTGRERALNWAREVGDAYRDRSFPDDGRVPLSATPFDAVDGVEDDGSLPVWAFAAGSAVGLFADLYDLTREERWVRAGRSLAEDVLAVFWKESLPRTAGSVPHYENQLGSGYLVYYLTRLALLDAAGDCPLPPCYSAR